MGPALNVSRALPILLRPAQRLRRFAGDESGSFTILTLYLLMTLFFVTGIAVDCVRYEAQRARLQNTLDRAILAAADMSQTMPAQDVVEQYFEKAGLSAYVPQATVTQGLNVKKVSARAESPMDTFYMRLLGINKLTPVAAGTAEESISDIEVSLVLDISGSMGDDIYTTVTQQTRYGSRTYKYNTGVTKIESLKNAAGEFVDTIFNSTADTRTSMSVIPYASQVEVPPYLLAQYNITSTQTYNSCVDFTTADFSNTRIDPNTAYQRSDHFDPFYTSAPPTLTVCDTDPDNAIIPLSGSPDKLKTMIGKLQAQGNTSIDVGMKWGTALLDPSARTPVTNLISQNYISDDFAGRPYGYNNTQTMKVIVVMTDGHNTDQYYLNSGYRSGLSPVFKYVSNGTTYYSLKVAEGNNTDVDKDGVKNEPYWIESEWTSTTSSCGRNCTTTTYNPNKWQSQPKGGNQAVQLTYPQLWALMSVRYYANMRKAVFNSNTDYNNAMNSYSAIGATEKDTRLNSICTTAKNAGIIVFAIGFQVDDTDASKLEGCASSPSHFYRVEGLEITTAFQSIANAIGKLRLTQ